MKILQIIDTLLIGGAEDVVANLSIGLRKRGHNVAVLLLSTSENTANEMKLRKAKIPIFYLHSKKYSATSIFEAEEIIKNFQPEIINSHLSGYYYSYLIHKKVAAKTVH